MEKQKGEYKVKAVKQSNMPGNFKYIYVTQFMGIYCAAKVAKEIFVEEGLSLSM
jgi:hypothetical protein